MHGDQLKEWIVVKPDAFTSKSGDAETSVVEKSNSDIHALVGSRNGELHQFRYGEWPHGEETQGLPCIDRYRAGFLSRWQDEIDFASSDKHNSYRCAFTFVRFESGEKHGREQVLEDCVGCFSHDTST